MERLNKDTEKKITFFDEAFKIRFHELQKRVDELKEEKSRQEIELKKEAQKETDEAINLFEKIINEGVSQLI
ncbi:MAG: hypothetical protein HYV28_04990 [Ignavibacteriales bacterium]|nr:hypothetical protein [Ignavibacteriales bacterium]